MPAGVVELLERATNARPVSGNRLVHEPHSPAALEAMVELIGGANRRILLENYIIRDDHTGRRFAERLAERAVSGAEVRVLYDVFGCRGTSRAFWRELRRAGVEVRAFGRLDPIHPSSFLVRNHRKLLVVDGERACVGGLCVGDEWAGDAGRGRLPWRDTALLVRGPTAAVLEHSFHNMWSLAGPSTGGLPSLPEVQAYGDAAVRVIESAPGSGRMSRTAQILCDAARERIWITDAYLVLPAMLFRSLLDAAHAGLDVRILVPGTSDAPLVRDLTRESYRELLEAGVRVFEWSGPMLHVKTMVVDSRWARIGSTNLNARSLYRNYELDVLLEAESHAEALAAQFRRDLAFSTEILLQPHPFRRARLVSPDAPRPADHRPTLHERRVRATVTLRRITWRMRRRLLAAAAVLLLVAAALLVLFPRAMGGAVAIATALVGVPLGLEALLQRPGERP